MRKKKERGRCKDKEVQGKEIQHRGGEKETNTSRDRKTERRKGRKMGVNCRLTSRKKRTKADKNRCSREKKHRKRKRKN